MHITAGKHYKRRIELPSGKDIRPTSSMVREAIFNVLTNMLLGDGKNFADTTIADICCGCGTLGLEALSRGVSHVIFIDNNRNSLEQTKYNVEKFDETNNANFIKSDATMLPSARVEVDVILLDPPYKQDLPDKIINSIIKNNWLKSGGILMLELDIKDIVPEHSKLEIIKQKLCFILIMEG